MNPEDFWNQDEVHKDQKFYVGFCMLESALGDYAIARDLHLHKKLNWAVTTYYYSLVHALRLVCFTSQGDFPNGHADLATLYTEDNIALKNKKRWLPQFIKNLGNNTQIEDSITFKHMEVARYFNNDITLSSVLDEKLQMWGNILNKGRTCRNDSNYEGLIIAHEYSHRQVTDDLNKLTTLLEDATDSVLPEVVSLFKLFMDKSTRKDYWYSYLNWKCSNEGLDYFEKYLKFRILGKCNECKVWTTNKATSDSGLIFDIPRGNLIINRIFEWLEILKSNNAKNDLAANVLDNIKLERFSEKGKLMQDFSNQINSLETVIRR